MLLNEFDYHIIVVQKLFFKKKKKHFWKQIHLPHAVTVDKPSYARQQNSNTHHH